MQELSSFLPYYLTSKLVEGQNKDPLQQEERFPAVVLFADVAGFTPLSEVLGKIGRTGTEELNVLLNRYFDDMISLIHSYGGMVAKFGGDALTVLFRYAETEVNSKAGAVQNALWCALDMQNRVQHYTDLSTSAGIFSLHLKVGLALGSIFSTSVGNPSTRLEYIVAGDVLERSAQAEHLAQEGQIILHNELLPFAEAVKVEWAGENYSRLVALESQVTKTALPPMPTVPPDLYPVLSAYLHPAIATRLEAGRSDFIAEHRKVSIIFTAFEYFDFDHDPQAGSKLQAYLKEVIRVVQRYDGYLRQVEMGDKGSKYIIFFGAPVAHENDEYLAIRCALDLQQVAYHAGVITHTGINTAQVFCGLVGSESRRDYSALGDGVNLAARLMQIARPGQILVSTSTRQHVDDRFQWVNLSKVRLKGKAEPVSISVPLDTSQARAIPVFNAGYRLPMVGREPELKKITGLMSRAMKGRGQITGVTGEAGMGKSRLVNELVKWAEEQGFSSFTGECLSYATGTSYLVWESILRQFFGLGADESPYIQAAKLERRIRSMSPDFAERAFLVSAILNLPQPENAPAKPLDPRFRKQITENLLVECFKKRAATRPLLLIFEDIHWLDPLSADLLEAVARGIGNSKIILLLTYRPAEIEKSLTERLLSLPYATEIRLHDFGRQEVERLVELKLNQLFGPKFKVPTPLLKRVRERAGGNPFYINETINLLFERRLNLDDTEALQQVEWPDSLQSLILSRLDRLDDSLKTLLKIASVIGRTFKAEWLWGTYPALGGPEQVRPLLQSLEQLEVIEENKQEAEPEYSFRHIIMRDVVYESIAYATRSELHTLVGNFIEGNYRDRLEQYLDLLAYHFSHSQRIDKQREYLRRTGEAAQAAYANKVAIGYFQRLLPLLAGSSQLEILFKLGDLHVTTGKWPEAIKTFEDILAQAEQIGDSLSSGMALSRIGRIMNLQGKYPEASGYYQRALEIQEQIGDKAGLAFTLNSMGVMYMESGKYAEALNCYNRALEIQESLGDQLGQAKSLNNMGNLNAITENLPMAMQFYTRSLEKWKSIGDKQGIAQLAHNMGNVTLYSGDYEKALDYYKQATQAEESIGDASSLGASLIGMGTVYQYVGQFDLSLKYFKQAVQINENIGDSRKVAMCFSSIGTTYQGMGKYPEALDYYRHALKIRETIDDRYNLAGTHMEMGYLYFEQGKYEEALAALEKSQALYETLGLNKVGLMSLPVIALTQAYLGNHEKAVATLATALARLKEVELQPESVPIFYYDLYRALNLGLLAPAAEMAGLQGLPEDGIQHVAREYLELAYNNVMERFGRLKDEDKKRAFLSKIKLNREIIEAWEGSTAKLAG